MAHCKIDMDMKQVINTQAAHHHAVAKAERIHGVIGAYWNPRTHEMTIRYDARVTSARHIMHLVA